ncbi:unnamed protein product [Ambrosiozyma monospora]|uniref:Unnamed protein product n=1 Tax=Ambrosiozyma monospora TaxID=43982 RepID=A0ACB5T6Z3_AMBMO|nr:unnamed protein product [Ambrosiozyma monospora]
MYEDDYMGYTPTVGNLVFIVVWFILLVAQTSLAILSREFLFGLFMVLGCVLEFLGFIGRLALNRDGPTFFHFYTMSIIGTLTSPLFFMAAIYQCFDGSGRLIEIFGKEYSLVKPINYRRIFLPLNALCFLVQIIGGGIAGGVGRDGTVDQYITSKTGLYIMFAGLILQLVTMTGFMVIGGYFVHRVGANRNYLDQRFTEIRKTKLFKGVMWSLCVAVPLIYIRSVFRAVETACLWGNSSMIHTEILFLVLDGAFCVIAVLLLTVFHPGRLFKKTRSVIQVDDIALHRIKDTDGRSMI